MLHNTFRPSIVADPEMEMMNFVLTQRAGIRGRYREGVIPQDMVKNPTKHVRFSASTRTTPPSTPEVPKITKPSQGQARYLQVEPAPKTRHFAHPEPYLPKPRVQLHPSLAYGAISFDLRYAAEVGYAVGSEPAVFPPVACLKLTTASLTTAWDVVVYPQSSRKGFVTVMDVLDALHRSLREHVSREEYEWYSGGSERTMRKIVAAFERRCQTRASAHYYYEREKRSGIRRVDFLHDRTRLVGLAPTERPDKWIYYVA